MLELSRDADKKAFVHPVRVMVMYLLGYASPSV